MAFEDDLQAALEAEESETVGTAFGGNLPTTHGSYAIVRIRDWVIRSTSAEPPSSPLAAAISRARAALSQQHFKLLVESLLRFSFLIELTNLTVGSTKMKTRWLPGKILMPQPHSFEPVHGTFEPGTDPRASVFNECCAIFATACNMVCDKIAQDPALPGLLQKLNKHRRIPYEFPLSYTDVSVSAIHVAENVRWALNEDIKWLLDARALLSDAQPPHREAVREIIKKKLQVKVFETDRSLTGKDKTNRAKRWEVLPEDFQHATLEQCWSAERQLTRDLVGFSDFPSELKEQFLNAGIVDSSQPPTCCPVTLEPLSFITLSTAVLTATHGASDYQIGHLHPLKRGGSHDGNNVRWQSADGNRIQGDLTIEETSELLNQIAARRRGH